MAGVTPLEKVTGALEAAGSRRSGRDWQCPAHEDQHASLSVNEGREGRVLLKCHAGAGCPVEEIVAALGLTMSDLFPERERFDDDWTPRGPAVATYRYVDEHGRMRFTVCRTAGRDFPQWRPDPAAKTGKRWKLNDDAGRRLVPWLLYRLPKVLQEAKAGGTVHIPEGEKDVDALERAGVVATCNPGGAGKWRDEYAAALVGCTSVIVWRDRDEKGRQHAAEVVSSLQAAGVPVGLVEAKDGKDAADHLAAGHGPYDFVVVDEQTEDHPAADDPPVVTGRRLRLTPASAIRIRPVRWVWEERMPAGALTLIPGREGVGKSLFLAWLTAQLTRGKLPGVHKGTPKPVIYAATEDSWEHTIAPRLLAAGANMDLVYRVEVVEDDDAVVPLTLPVDCGRLTVEIQRIGAALLALDPLMSVIAPGIDTHRDRELRTALEPLVAVGGVTGSAIAGLAHFNKSASSDPMNLITGSRAFGSVTRAVLAAARDPDSEDDSYVLSQEKNNLGRLDLPSLSYVINEATVDTDEGPSGVGLLKFTGESNRSVRDILGDRGDPEERAERDGAAEFIRYYLGSEAGEAPAADVLKAGKEAGFAERTLQRARGKAGARTEKSEFGGVWVWTLRPQRRHEGAIGAKDSKVGAYGAFVAPLGDEAAAPGGSNEQAPGRFDRNRGEETVAERFAEATQPTLDGKVRCRIHRDATLDAHGGCEQCRRAAHPGLRP